MPLLQSVAALALAAEPASILYIVTGVIGLACAGFGKSDRVSGAAKAPETSSTAMLFCRKASHERLHQARLL
jgi:hypothetical protein